MNKIAYKGYRELPANIIDNLFKENKGIIYLGLYIPAKKWFTFSFISPYIQKLLGKLKNNEKPIGR